MTEPAPKPPSGLRGSGKALWTEVLTSFELTSGELEVLRQAVRCVDEADKLERELRKQPFTVAALAITTRSVLTTGPPSVGGK